MRPQRTIKLQPVPRNCPFCNTNTSPLYREVETLRRYTSDRGKVLAHTRTGVCSKHQRQIAQEIKRARHIGLLPFVNR